MSSWNYEMLEREALQRAEQKFENTPADALKRIAELEAQLHVYSIALGPILDKSWRGTSVSSQLFPMRPENHAEEHMFFVFNRETHKSDKVILTEEQYADSDYYTEEGLTIQDGTKLSDDFELLSFHQQAPGCSIGNGSITVGDIKRTIEIVNKP